MRAKCKESETSWKKWKLCEHFLISIFSNLSYLIITITTTLISVCSARTIHDASFITTTTLASFYHSFQRILSSVKIGCLPPEDFSPLDCTTTSKASYEHCRLSNLPSPASIRHRTLPTRQSSPSHCIYTAPDIPRQSYTPNHMSHKYSQLHPYSLRLSPSIS